MIKQHGLNFYELLDIIRKEKKVTLRQLSYGLCSEAEMSYILSGTRTPSYQMRNRFISRMGIESEEFEDFINDNDYSIWLEFNNLFLYLRDNKLTEAEHLLDILKKTSNDVIQQQILMDISARILKIKGTSARIIKEKYFKAISLSMKDINLYRINDYILSPYEYSLIFEYLCMKSIDSTNGERKSVINIFFELIDYVASLEIDVLQKAKVLPRAVCLLYEASKNQVEFNNIYVNKIQKYTEYCILLLKESNRLYSLFELVQIRKELMCESTEDIEVLQALIKFYTEYNIPVDDLFDTYMYEDSMVYNLSDVIKSRRLLLGKTQKEIAKGVCSVKTIYRIEQKETNPQPTTFKMILRNLNIFSDYRRLEIITKDIEDIRLYNSYKIAKNRKDNILAKDLLVKLNHKIDNNIPANQQVISKLFLDMDYDDKKISETVYKEKLEELLEITLDIKNKFNLNEDLPFLTISEKKLLFSIVRSEYDNRYRDSKYSVFFMKMCSKSDNHLIHALGIKYYELYASLYASMLADLHEFEKSNAVLNTIIYHNLAERRNTCLVQSIYDKIWNEAVQTQNYYKTKYNKLFLKIISLSSFTLDKRDHIFFENAFLQYKNRINWTL